MRLFLAVNFPDELRASVASAIAPARLDAPGVAWVRPALLHLTVKFIGERPPADVGRIVPAVADVARRSAPFVAQLGGAGAFPNFRAPRVVWIGMRHAAPLESLAARIDDTLSSTLGIARERRPFCAHLTLGRVKRELASTEAATLERALRAVQRRWDAPVRSVDLMQSTLSSGGPSYACLATIPLGEGS